MGASICALLAPSQVLNEAVGAMMYHTITLTREDLDISLLQYVSTVIFNLFGGS